MPCGAVEMGCSRRTTRAVCSASGVCAPCVRSVCPLGPALAYIVIELHGKLLRVGGISDRQPRE